MAPALKGQRSWHVRARCLRGAIKSIQREKRGLRLDAGLVPIPYSGCAPLATRKTTIPGGGEVCGGDQE